MSELGVFGSGWMVRQADVAEYLAVAGDDSFDLTFTSPPYGKAREYGELKFNLSDQAWVDWLVPIIKECVRVTKGLVCFVVEGQTKNYQWDATPALLMADLHRAGVCLRKPFLYQRHGVAGSGGPDWWKNNYEWVICATKGGKLPWSDPLACAHPPKYKPGGGMSNRKKNDERVCRRPYVPPEKANPGNVWVESGVVNCGAVGGGNLGHPDAHGNEAPFPLQLIDPVVLSFCPPGGLVFDPFCGSGSTLHSAIQNGRRGFGLDVRASEVGRTAGRLRDVEFRLLEAAKNA